MSAKQVYSSLYRYEPDEMSHLIRKAYAYYGSIVLKTPFRWHEEEINWDRVARESVEGNHLLLKLLPPVPGISEMSFRCRVERDGLITTLALLRYKNDKGGFPADLQELISNRYMSRLPMDPYSDKPLVYRRTENNFTFYSIGADFQDNGGKHSSKWGLEAEGGDFVFWPVPNE